MFRNDIKNNLIAIRCRYIGFTIITCYKLNGAIIITLTFYPITC